MNTSELEKEWHQKALPWARKLTDHLKNPHPGLITWTLVVRDATRKLLAAMKHPEADLSLLDQVKRLNDEREHYREKYLDAQARITKLESRR